MTTFGDSKVFFCGGFKVQLELSALDWISLNQPELRYPEAMSHLVRPYSQ